MPAPTMDQAITAATPYGGPNEPSYSGVTSFMRRKYTKDLAGADVAITGVPLDLATTGRPGARFGPRGLRAASANIAWGKPFPWGFDPFETIAAIDYGDCFFDMGHPGAFAEAIEAHTRTIVQAGVVPLTLGGDHFVTYPVLKAVAEKHGPLSLIHFDAHSDTWAEEDKRLDHGTMFYWAAKEGLVDPAHSVQVGLRTWNDETHGYNILTAPWIHEYGIEAAVSEIRARVGTRPVYITFDIDCLDPAFAPGTGTPVPGGLSSAQALGIVRGLTKLAYTGFDLVEVAPPYDHAEMTALAGAQIALEYLCLMADARR